ncbi:MAG TPA: hypothetical protein VGO68_00135 [Pyrinomonadaceae bacterium]|jgi:hypothetical protein|nr:hypothetical protein [Pyrinomonadaceae bacterium]
MLKTHAATVVEELFPEAGVNCSPAKDVERAEALLQIEEQEVGIT